MPSGSLGRVWRDVPPISPRGWTGTSSAREMYPVCSRGDGNPHRLIHKWAESCRTAGRHLPHLSKRPRDFTEAAHDRWRTGTTHTNTQLPLTHACLVCTLFFLPLQHVRPRRKGEKLRRARCYTLRYYSEVFFHSSYRSPRTS